MIIIIVILIYLFSIFGAWKLFQLEYSKNGQWRYLEAALLDVIIIFVPAVNTGFSFVFLLRIFTKNVNFNSFFHIKK